MAVYSPKNKLPWDDAVTLVLKYAEIPYDVLYDDEVIRGDFAEIRLACNLHHEDFTGQYSKFYGAFRLWRNGINDDEKIQETTAHKTWFLKKVSQMKLGRGRKRSGIFCARGWVPVRYVFQVLIHLI